MTSGVYIIRNLTNGKVYIGASANVERRWRNHENDLRRGVHHSSHLQRAWLKYGEDAFAFDVLEETSDLSGRESWWISHVRPDLRGRGFNLFGGASGHHERSAEHRERMSRIKAGRKASDETRAKISASKRGTRWSAEFRARRKLNPPVLSEAGRQKIRLAHVGRKLSIESKAKLAAALRASWQRRRSDSCKNGHPYSEFLVMASGFRACRECRRLNAIRHNARRTAARRAAPKAPPRRPPPRTHCHKGHPLTSENVILEKVKRKRPNWSDVARRCRICRNASWPGSSRRPAAVSDDSSGSSV